MQSSCTLYAYLSCCAPLVGTKWEQAALNTALGKGHFALISRYQNCFEHHKSNPRISLTVFILINFIIFENMILSLLLCSLDFWYHTFNFMTLGQPLQGEFKQDMVILFVLFSEIIIPTCQALTLFFARPQSCQYTFMNCMMYLLLTALNCTGTMINTSFLGQPKAFLKIVFQYAFLL